MDIPLTQYFQMHVVIFQFLVDGLSCFLFLVTGSTLPEVNFTGSQRIVSLVVETSETSTTPFIGVGSLMLCVTTSMLLVVVTIPDEALLRCHGHFPWEGRGIRALWLDPQKAHLTRGRILLGPTAGPQR